MSRSHKSRGKYWRIVKNSLYKKSLRMWGDEFYHRRKDRTVTRRLRTRLKRTEKKEIKEQFNEI